MHYKREYTFHSFIHPWFKGLLGADQKLGFQSKYLIRNESAITLSKNQSQNNNLSKLGLIKSMIIYKRRSLNLYLMLNVNVRLQFVQSHSRSKKGRL